MRTTTLIAASLLSSVSAAPALAQGSGAADAAAADNPTIVVNARRREEALADVPIAVSAITDQQLETRSLERVEDFLRATPSATVVFAGPEYLRDVSIRGQGGGRNGFSDSATGLYRNGIYVAGGGFGGRSFNALDLFDVRSFEVYRGPQGALYGRNAVGGAVNIISNQPRDATTISAQVGYDGRERFTRESIVNVALTDKFAIRVGGIAYDQNGGFITDRATGADLDVTDFAGLRIAARLSDLAGFTLTGTYEFSQTNAPGFSALGQRTAVPARPTAVFDADRDIRNASRYGRVAIEEDSVFVNLDRSFGAVDFAGVFTYKIRNAGRFNEDLDHFIGFEGVGGSDLIVAQNERFERTGAEVRLSSAASSNFNWLIGADWQRYTDVVSTVNSGVTTVANLREQATRSDFSTERQTSYSAFGSVEFDFTDTISASFEGRVQRDEKTFLFQRVDRAPIPTNTSIAPISLAQAETRFSPGATLKWQATPDAQAYLRLSSAFRPAGFNAGTGTLSAIPYAAEKARGAEVGFKFPLIKGVRASASVYYLRLNDPQIVTTVSATDTTVVLQNIPNADFVGVELELNGQWQLGRGRLSVDISGATQSGKFGDGSFVTVNGVTYNVSNTRANRVRDFIGSLSATYDVSFGKRWSGFLTVATNGETGGFENAVGALNVPNVSRVLEGYQLVSLRAGVRGYGFTLSAFVNNLTDERYITQNVQGNNYYNEGRVFGVALRKQFGGTR